MGLNLFDLDRIDVEEFDAWADQLEKVQKKRDREEREAKRAR